MSDRDSNQPEAPEQQAAEWVLRQDRGLSAEEQDQFSQWLAADARHGRALAEHRWGWEELDRLAGLQTSLGAFPDSNLLAPARTKGRRWPAFLVSTLAAAAVVALGVRFGPWPTPAPANVSRAVLLAPCEHRTLEDGSVVELNRGAAIAVRFTADERHVRLERGEAHFAVVKDAARPFTVEARGVAVHAVGTAFSVSLETHSIAVLVTEGSVNVDRPATGANVTNITSSYLEAGQRTVVSLSSQAPTPAVVTVTAAEMEERLAWKPRLLDFNDAPLADIAAEFNRRNPVKLSLADGSLAARRLSASFRSDNVEGFVRLMESDFGMRAEWPSETEIVLRRVK